MKTCTTCKISKPKSEFGNHAISNDGLRYSCKPCSSSDNKAYHEANREKRNAAQAAWNLVHREEINANQRARRRMFPERMAAYKSARRAIKNGKLIKLPCEACGTEESVHGHHENYSKPLEVTWLCIKHHGERHVEIKAMIKVILTPAHVQ